MSYKLMHDVLHCDAVGGNDKFVLMALADHMNETTLKCFPSYEMVAKITGLGRATVARSIKALKERGLIVSDHVGFAKSNNYLIVLPDSPQQSHSDTNGASQQSHSETPSVSQRDSISLNMRLHQSHCETLTSNIDSN